jgi:hypothetical protein
VNVREPIEGGGLMISIQVEDGDVAHLLWCLEAGETLARFAVNAAQSTEDERVLGQLRRSAVSRLTVAVEEGIATSPGRGKR